MPASYQLHGRLVVGFACVCGANHDGAAGSKSYFCRRDACILGMPLVLPPQSRAFRTAHVAGPPATVRAQIFG